MANLQGDYTTGTAVELSADGDGWRYGDSVHADACPCGGCQQKRYQALLDATFPVGVEIDSESTSTKERHYYVFTSDEAQASYQGLIAEGEDKDGISTAGFSQYTRPLSGDAAPPVLPALTREDGSTLFYRGRLNSIFGEASGGKSWIALMAAVSEFRYGARCVWWDFEDYVDTLKTRLSALDAEDLIGRPELQYLTADLANDGNAMAAAAKWVMRGDIPGLVVIDSCESAGLATDSNDAAPWYQKMINPWRDAGATIILIDHVPKRRQDRPLGAIGSQFKRDQIRGAGLYVMGTAWTKTQAGTVTLYNHKDAIGDLPAPQNKKVAMLTATPEEGGKLSYQFTALDANADEPEVLESRLLNAIAETGSEGVRGKEAVRRLTKARGREVDASLNDLRNRGLVERERKEGDRSFTYYATGLGIQAIEDGL